MNYLNTRNELDALTGDEVHQLLDTYDIKIRDDESEADQNMVSIIMLLRPAKQHRSMTKRVSKLQAVSISLSILTGFFVQLR
jgi:hypothetical protein